MGVITMSNIRTYSAKKDGKKKLSEHFTVKNMASKDGADKVLIDLDLITYLERIRTHFNKPITITSGYRSPSHNKKVGGVTGSYHTKGMAADIIISGVAPKKVAQYAESLNMGGIGLYSGFTHVDTRSGKSRWNGSGKSVKGFGGTVTSEANDVKNQLKNNNTKSGGLTSSSPTPTSTTATKFKYTNSPLVAHVNISKEKNVPRNHPIDRITPHCIVGQVTSWSGLDRLFHGRKITANYALLKDGRVGLYVDERDRSWCTCSRENDNRAITIECSSGSKHPYEFNNDVYQSLKDLCVDICRRNGKNKLIWIPDKSKAFNYKLQPGEMLITVHRWFYKKSCPGDWLYNRLGDVANYVNARISDVVPLTAYDKEWEGYTEGEISSSSSSDSGYTYTSDDGTVTNMGDSTTGQQMDELQLIAQSVKDRIVEDVHVNDDFTIAYGGGSLTTEQYVNNLSTNGLKVKDILNILGCPHQFSPLADPRIDSTTSNITTNYSGIGRIFGDKILKHMPLLLIVPGLPEFLSSFSQDQKKTVLTGLFAGVSGALKSDMETLFTSTNGKYYSLRYAYVEYFSYLNPILRAAAIFLNIGHVKVNGKRLDDYNYMKESGANTTDRNLYNYLGIGDSFGPYAHCLAIYADCGNTVDDSFSNSTTQSMLAGIADSVSDKARDINFIIGDVGSAVGGPISRLLNMETIDTAVEDFTDLVNHIIGNNDNVVSRILGKARSVLQGGRMIFPEIWSDSSFSKQYSCKMKLVSPSGDKLSVFLNILKPIYYLWALTMPRQGAASQTYYSPLLVRAFCKSLFNVDMGIITDLAVTKGEEGEWTVDGIPTVAEVSFSIKDLYDNIYMSKFTVMPMDPSGIMSNITELDYIANSCGININDQDHIRTVKLYMGLFKGRAKDFVSIDILGGMSQWLNNKAQKIFGAF